MYNFIKITKVFGFRSRETQQLEDDTDAEDWTSISEGCNRQRAIILSSQLRIEICLTIFICES